MSARHVVVDGMSLRARSRGETIVDNGLRGRWRGKEVWVVDNMLQTLISDIMLLLHEEDNYRKENMFTLLLSFIHFETSHLMNVSLLIQVDVNISLNFSIILDIDSAYIYFQLYACHFDALLISDDEN